MEDELFKIDQETLSRTCNALLLAGKKIDAVVLWARATQGGLLDAKYHIDGMAAAIGPVETQAALLGRIQGLKTANAALEVQVDNLDAELKRAQHEADEIKDELLIVNTRLTVVGILGQANLWADIRRLLGLGLDS